MELVVVPFPGMGHLVSLLEMAKLLVARDARLSANVIVINMPDSPPVDLTSFKQSLSTESDRIHFIEIPKDERHSTREAMKSKSPPASFINFIRAQIPFVQDAIATHVTGRSGAGRLIAFLVDIFCVSLIDTAQQDFGVPAYIFNPSNASTLGLDYHLLSLSDNGHDITDFDGSNAELAVPAYPIPFPAKVLPWRSLDKNGGSVEFLDLIRNLRRAKGIVVNAFYDVEPEAIESIMNDDEGSPPIYSVGPILNLRESSGEKRDDIVRWLDRQPPSSVIFLCFGSMGSFEDEQVKQIAIALERSGHRFLWSVRRPASSGGKPWSTSEYDDLELEEVMPEGFLGRTAEIGKMIGWAPQVDVLGHKAVGGFVTHCGWNSIMEGLWFGVPMACWPLYAEQQANAFQMIKVLGVAVEIKMDYKSNWSKSGEGIIVEAAIIENALRNLMDENGRENQDRRKRVKEMSEKSRKAVQEGGSSYLSLGRFIDDITI